MSARIWMTSQSVRYIFSLNILFLLYISNILKFQLEVLALFCASRKPRFRLCGLMDLDYSKGLSILLTIVLHIIYLVQTYYVVFSYE